MHRGAVEVGVVVGVVVGAFGCTGGVVCMLIGGRGVRRGLLPAGPSGPHHPAAQVCEREVSDKKGGHLARRKKDGRLM